MKYKFFDFLLVLCLFFSHTVFAMQDTIIPEQSIETNELSLTAEAAILMDATSGQILYKKNSDTKQYPASITKLMTILLALEKMEAENIHLTDTITFSHDAIYTIEPGSSHIAIQEGETLTLEQVLYGIILQSANECSNGIAEFVDGSTEAFAKHMTARAKELGCQNTNFVNANGLFDKDHYTTAHDMALITKQLLTHDTYRKLVEKTYYEIPPTNKQDEIRYLHGQHQMLNKHSLYYYPEAKGGKTGFTNEALNTLVTFAKKGNTELIVVVLKCAGAQHYVDTKTLFDYGFDNYKTVKAISATDIAQDVTVTETLQNKTNTKQTISAILKQDVYVTIPKQGSVADIQQTITCNDTVSVPIAKDDITNTKQTISAILKQDVYVTIPKQGSVADIQQTITCNDTVSVPIAKDDILGTLTLSYEGKPIARANLVASDAVAETTKEELAQISAKKRSDIFKTIALVVIGILLLLFMAFLAYRYLLYQKQERQRAKRKAARKRRLQQGYQNNQK